MLKRFINSLSNQNGSSLVQVMVIAGMVSVFGLAVMQTQKNVQSVQTTLLTRDSNTELKNAVTALLKYPTVCQMNLSYFSRGVAVTKTGPDDFVTDPDLLLIDVESNPVYVADNTTSYFGRSRITRFRIGHYDAAKNLATLKIIVNNVAPGASGGLNLGAKSQEIDIGVRVYYDGGGVLTRCMAEEVPVEESYANAAVDTQLSQLCTSDLGGSFYNGDCKIPEYVERSAKSKTHDNTTATDNMCQNFGGAYDPATGRCTEGFMSGAKIFCPGGEKIKGFDNAGNAICP
ncbi:MAG: hypothetical protein COW01_10705 [Bdellovibrionales bacterium CG12_big_fil_rev_8_21_14_0_65_38_15]|nr:MAG: hypothetical protein COW79_07550 [Bdellovibrionales bacterium CG22_combo_CG10-13_8_21_14_all_38_13]PIQ54606.1 MAG: hypothetical protein COW01_10705 [Bdellovibrionales bacterium CG12_big_fil_rev_8_21_14_0_65_38_15]PIR29987.1 MAG: hypothetical protein COV38_08550 [Bdellovibrionales bacterium CG11_big_fil_rev_8_21_14_0_20_38_13]